MCIQTCGETEKLNGAHHWNIRSITKNEIFTKYPLSFHGGKGFIFLLSSTSDIYLLQECRCRHFIREIKLSLLHYLVHNSRYSTEQSKVLNQLAAGNIKIRNDYRQTSNEGVVNNQFSYPRLYVVGIKKASSTLKRHASVPLETQLPVYNTTRWHMIKEPNLQEETSLEIKFISVPADQIWR
jgi:hypothetical protein